MMAHTIVCYVRCSLQHRHSANRLESFEYVVLGSARPPLLLLLLLLLLPLLLLLLLNRGHLQEPWHKSSAPGAADAARYARATKNTTKYEEGRNKRPAIWCN